MATDSSALTTNDRPKQTEDLRTRVGQEHADHDSVGFLSHHATGPSLVLRSVHRLRFMGVSAIARVGGSSATRITTPKVGQPSMARQCADMHSGQCTQDKRW